MGLTDTAIILAVFAFFGLVIWGLITRLRDERATQPTQERSSLWLLFAAGIGAYAFAYFAFGEHLQAPIRLALAALAVASVVVARRHPRTKH